MSLRFLHQVIIFAAFAISLFFAGWCFFSPDAGGRYLIAGFVSILVAIFFIGYEVHFVRKTRRLIL